MKIKVIDKSVAWQVAEWCKWKDINLTIIGTWEEL